MVKCKFSYIAGLDKDNKPITKEIWFVRTLNTELMFRNELNAEYNGQIGILSSIMVKLENSQDDPKAISAYTDLKFSETRHQLLQFAYAEVSEAGTFIQNEKTRANYDKLVDRGLFDEKVAFSTFFQCF